MEIARYIAQWAVIGSMMPKDSYRPVALDAAIANPVQHPFHQRAVLPLHNYYINDSMTALYRFGRKARIAVLYREGWTRFVSKMIVIDRLRTIQKEVPV